MKHILINKDGWCECNDYCFSGSQRGAGITKEHAVITKVIRRVKEGGVVK